jgi:C1A family cysteine protease
LYCIKGKEPIMPRMNVKQLNRALKGAQARWIAVTDPAKAAKIYSLGYTPGPSDHSLRDRELVAQRNHQQFMEMATPPAYPSRFDWRNVSGHNFMTPVRDQRRCGACVAFGCIAAVESAVRIRKKNPGLNIDLSEAHLFYCHGNAAGGTCKTGWDQDAALTSLRNHGVVDEACYPYTDHDQPCGVCRDWQKRLRKIKAWHKITSHAEMKAWISSGAPVVTAFTVCDDFFAYKSGVYHHVCGAIVGGHSVCCVGYDDMAQYWICKNSWGPGWGERGFFRIQYGQNGIDAAMWAVEA